MARRAQAPVKIDPGSSAVAWYLRGQTNDLLVCWRDARGNEGEVYLYTPVDPALYARLRRTASVGRFMNRVIKRQTSYYRVSAAYATALKGP